MRGRNPDISTIRELIIVHPGVIEYTSLIALMKGAFILNSS
jgi:hypothetical protein